MGNGPVESVQTEERLVDAESEEEVEVDPRDGKCVQSTDNWIAGPPNIPKIKEYGDTLGTMYRDEKFKGISAVFPYWPPQYRD